MNYWIKVEVSSKAHWGISLRTAEINLDTPVKTLWFVYNQYNLHLALFTERLPERAKQYDTAGCYWANHAPFWEEAACQPSTSDRVPLSLRGLPSLIQMWNLMFTPNDSRMKKSWEKQDKETSHAERRHPSRETESAFLTSCTAERGKAVLMWERKDRRLAACSHQAGRPQTRVRLHARRTWEEIQWGRWAEWGCCQRCVAASPPADETCYAHAGIWPSPRSPGLSWWKTSLANQSGCGPFMLTTDDNSMCYT